MDLVAPEVILYYTYFNQQLSEKLWQNYLCLIPIKDRERLMRFLRWEDKHSFLLGRLLLIEAFKQFDHNKFSLEEIKFDQQDKPYIESDIDFNISHSGEYVICAIGKDLKIGVDIEEIKEIDFNNFKKVMTNEQWKCIKKSANPTKSFFKYWTIKESVIKADSRGLSIPLLNIQLKNNIAFYDNKSWYLNKLKIDKNYCTCLATDQKHINIKMIEIDFSKPSYIKKINSKEQPCFPTRKVRNDMNISMQGK